MNTVHLKPFLHDPSLVNRGVVLHEDSIVFEYF
jgi:hypothetical protein